MFSLLLPPISSEKQKKSKFTITLKGNLLVKRTLLVIWSEKLMSYHDHTQLGISFSK